MATREPPRRVGDLVREATERLRRSGSESARLDAELLLGHVLGTDRTTILAHPEATVGDGQLAAFDAAVARRAAGEPVAYIRGMKEFHGLAFSVDDRALIPRPETELLVDVAIARVRSTLAAAPRPADAPPLVIWDVGTGSGAVIVAVGRALRRAGFGAAIRLMASDVSPEALDLAIENAVAHGVADGMVFRVGDLLEPEPPDGRPVDVILANLPYIPSAVVPTLPIAASFEPAAALDGGADGLELLRRALTMLPERLAPGGVALFEIGADQEAAARGAASGWQVDVHRDLAGLARLLEVRQA